MPHAFLQEPHRDVAKHHSLKVGACLPPQDASYAMRGRKSLYGSASLRCRSQLMCPATSC